MKHYTKLFFAAAVAALGLASCAKEVAPVETPKDNLVTVHFGATAGIEGATKATLTPNEQETLFTSAWENGDVLSVKYFNDNMAEAQVVHATWNETSYSFSTALPEFTGRWIYRAAYPAPEADGSVEFGSSRTQKGNDYNSKYDLMRGTTMTEAPAGKTDDGKDIIFDMTRETAIAYFHFTSKLAEKVVSAKLSVTDGSIANSSVTTDYDNHFVFSVDKPLNEITITFEEGTAPDATDFKLWYNVRPTNYANMTLEVETTGHKMTISRNSSGAYYSGKLYKVVKDIADDKWIAKGGETPTESSYTIEFYSSDAGSTQIKETTKATTVVKSGLEFLKDQPFSGISNSYYGEKPDLRVGKSGAAGSVTIALSELGQYNATKIILSAKQFSTGKTFAIGVNGSAKQKPGEDYTDLEFSLDGSPLTSIKLNSDGYIYVRSITVVKGIDKRHNINVTEVDGGTLSASAIKAGEGTEITLTAEPQLGYEFNNDWSVTATDGTVINVVDNKFTMPAQDVTVSGTFSESTSTPTFASLAELVATGAPSTTAAKVTVTLTNEEITDLHKVTNKTGKTYTNGVFLMVGTQEVEVYCWNTPSDWKVGGTISGTLTNCDWKLFVDKNTQKATWELCPADYSELTYKAPLPTCATPVITIAEDGVVSIACETAGATIHYKVGDNPADPTEAAAVFSAVTLTDGQTIKAIAVAENHKPSAVASKKYTVGGATSYFVKVTTAPTDWSGKYLIVFGDNAHSYVDKKDLKSKNTNKLSIIDNKIESNETVNADMVEISKTTNGYKILLSDSKYLSVLASNACGSNTTGSVFTITLGTTGVSISGVDSKNATRTLCNNSTYYRMYTEVKESYTLPQLYKLAD